MSSGNLAKAKIMSKINVHEKIDESKFNKFFLGIFVLCSLAIIFDGYDLNVFGVIVPVLMKNEGYSPVQIGALASWGLAGLVIGSFLFGYLADVIGRKKTIVISMLVYSILTGLIGFSTGFTQFAFLRFVAGLGLAGVVPNVVSEITEYTPLKHRVKLCSMSTVGFPVGTVLASFMGILFLQELGWRFMFQIAFLELILVALMVYFLPDAIDNLLKKNQTGKIARILEKVDAQYRYNGKDTFFSTIPKSEKAPVASLFADRNSLNTILFWVVMFMNFYSNFGMQTWLPKLMIMQGYELGSSLQLLLTFNVGAVFGVIFGGMIASQIGYKKTLIVFFLVEAIFFALLGLNPSIGFLYIILFISGMAIFGAQGMLNNYIAVNYPMNVRTTAVGFAFGVGRCGAVVAPMMGGLLLAMSVPMYFNFLAFSIPALIGMIALIFTVPSKDA